MPVGWGGRAAEVSTNTKGPQFSRAAFYDGTKRRIRSISCKHGPGPMCGRPGCKGWRPSTDRAVRTRLVDAVGGMASAKAMALDRAGRDRCSAGAMLRISLSVREAVSRADLRIVPGISDGNGWRVRRVGGQTSGGGDLRREMRLQRNRRREVRTFVLFIAALCLSLVYFVRVAQYSRWMGLLFILTWGALFWYQVRRSRKS